MTMKHTGKVQGAIAFTILAGFFAVIGALIYTETKGSMPEAMLILVGSLGMMAGSVVNYFFGSSSGSQAKDSIIANSTMPPAGAVVRQATASVGSQPIDAGEEK